MVGWGLPHHNDNHRVRLGTPFQKTSGSNARHHIYTVMNHYGNIKKWNDERGFGFIQEEQTNTEYFAHISSFTPKTPRPQIGERVIFDTITSDKGRKEAKNIYYLERPKPQNRRADSQKNHRETSNNRMLPLLESLLSILVIAGIGYFIYNKFFTEKSSSNISTSPASVSSEHRSAQNYQCDGRRYCSQMHSCEEAKFFLKNCPNTEMDGDHDGTPCEQQWCTVSFD